MHLYTDATDIAIRRNIKWFQVETSVEVRNLTQSNSMAFCESYPIVMACVLLGSEWPRKRIVFHCDNQFTVHIITKGRSDIAIIMALIRKLLLC